jgi:hypothetical protein
MNFVVHMLAHTPPYVFVLLAYLIWQGVLSLRLRFSIKVDKLASARALFHRSKDRKREVT